MDPSYIMSQYYQDDFRRERRRSGAQYQEGTGSATLVMIAHVAAGLRRLAAGIEGWAAGSSEAAAQGQRNVPIR